MTLYVCVGVCVCVWRCREEEAACVGTAEVSFNLEAREKFLTLNPPDDVPYL